MLEAAVLGKLPKEKQLNSGGFPLTQEPNQPLSIDYTKPFHDRSLNMTEDPANRETLERILDLCEAQGVEVILVTTPISKAFMYDYDNFQVFEEDYADIARAHGLQFYDFILYKTRDTLFPDETAFYDEVHLNRSGAETFSRVFAETVQRAAAGEDVGELFYDNYTEMSMAVYDGVYDKK